MRFTEHNTNQKKPCVLAFLPHVITEPVPVDEIDEVSLRFKSSLERVSRLFPLS